MRRVVPATALTLAALGAAGCGAERQRPPDTAVPTAPGGTRAVALPDAGVRLRAPRAWARTPGQAPEVLQIASGRATVTLWRYPRTEPLPRSPAALGQATTDLLAAVRARDPGFTETLARARRVDGEPAVEVRGTGSVAGRRRALRSVHVFAFGGEVVVDALAEPRQARRVDREVLTPLLRSLRLAPPRAGG
jgi:hypothetical protein